MVKAGNGAYYSGNMRRDQTLPYLEQASGILVNKIKKSYNYHFSKNTFHGRSKIINHYYDFSKQNEKNMYHLEKKIHVN